PSLTIPQDALPQANSSDVAALKPPSPESETTRQPQKENEVNTPALPSSTIPQVTLPQANSRNVARVNPLVPVPETTREPPTVDEASIPTPVTLKSQVTTTSSNVGDSIKLRENSAIAVGVNPPIPLETT